MKFIFQFFPFLKICLLCRQSLFYSSMLALHFVSLFLLFSSSNSLLNNHLFAGISFQRSTTKMPAKVCATSKSTNEYSTNLHMKRLSPSSLRSSNISLSSERSSSSSCEDQEKKKFTWPTVIMPSQKVVLHPAGYYPQ